MSSLLPLFRSHVRDASTLILATPAVVEGLKADAGFVNLRSSLGDPGQGARGRRGTRRGEAWNAYLDFQPNNPASLLKSDGMTPRFSKHQLALPCLRRECRKQQLETNYTDLGKGPLNVTLPERALDLGPEMPEGSSQVLSPQ